MEWKALYALARASADAAQGDGAWRRGVCQICEPKTGKADRRGAFCFNVSTGGFTCFKCGSGGKLREHGGVSYEAAEQVKRALVGGPLECEVMPGGSVSLALNEGSIVTRHPWRYLHDRGVTAPLVQAADLHVCYAGRWANRIIMPITEPGSGRLAGYVGRAWSAENPKPYLYPRGMDRANLLYNAAALAAETDEPILVVEGVFDALSVWPDGVALLGKPSHAQEAMLAASPRPVAVVLDGDAWQEGVALALRLRAVGQRAGAVQLPAGQDPDEVGPEQLKTEARECIAL